MSDFSVYKDRGLAIKYLSRCLRDGSLVLFLGAGTSKGFGLPDWVSLINSLRSDPRINQPALSSTVNADALQLAADDIKDRIGAKELALLVKQTLYKDINALSISELFDKHLLVAISSLLMGSKRGHVTRVVSLNYDSMLEWFLSLFGFVVKTIFELPTVEGDEDVRIYHIHGFLPHDALNAKSSKEDELILGMEAIDRRLGNQGDLWFELTRHILYTGNCLFIGMSTRTLSDRALSPLLVSASDKLKDIRPTGFWLVMDDLDETKENEYRRKNLIPLKINDLNELVEFIFQISQSAIINT